MSIQLCWQNHLILQYNVLPAETCPHLKSASALNQEQRWRIFAADWQIGCARWLLVECPPKENNAMLQQAVTSTLRCRWDDGKEEEEWLCFCYHNITKLSCDTKDLMLFDFNHIWSISTLKLNSGFREHKVPGPLSVLFPNNLTWQSPWELDTIATLPFSNLNLQTQFEISPIYPFWIFIDKIQSWEMMLQKWNVLVLLLFQSISFLHRLRGK